MKKDVDGTSILGELIPPVRIFDAFHRRAITEPELERDSVFHPRVVIGHGFIPRPKVRLAAAPERILALELMLEAHTERHIEPRPIGMDA